PDPEAATLGAKYKQVTLGQVVDVDGDHDRFSRCRYFGRHGQGASACQHPRAGDEQAAAMARATKPRAHGQNDGPRSNGCVISEWLACTSNSTRLRPAQA